MNISNKKILVTGAAGFIGFHLTYHLVLLGNDVFGLDNINNYYDVNLKYSRLSEMGISIDNMTEYNTRIESSKYNNYYFIKINIEDKNSLGDLFYNEKFDVVINLAAQAGVRFSISNPDVYVQSNVVGFLNILESCNQNQVKHLIYASSSSVYGLNETIPFSTNDNVDHPISIYAATKKTNELMAHVYSHLYNLPTTGLRFFTVYGPWGRPDMAYFLFTDAIINNKPIRIFNNGEMLRDFTYIDDIIDGILKVINNPPRGNTMWDAKKPLKDSSRSPFRLFNIGSSSPVKLLDFIETLEEKLGKYALRELLPAQAGDVVATYADISPLEKELNFKSKTILKDGIDKFVDWYLSYYSKK